MKKQIKRGKKKALSPVIATILLIAIVMVIALILFVWFRGMVGDYGEKFGKNIQLSCGEVAMDASYSGANVYISNTGNIPIFKINVKISKPGGYQTKYLSEMASNWPSTGLKQGETFSADISSYTTDATSITLIPILIGTSSKGESKKTFVCDEKYGYELTL